MENESPLEQMEGVTADSCATRCSLSKECLSFNFCASTAKSSTSLCTLTAKHPMIKGAKTNRKEGCRNYFKPKSAIAPEEPTKPEGPEDPPPAEPPKAVMKPGYISGGKFTGIIFAMIFTGLILGVVGQLGWKTWKARGARDGGLGLDVPSVRWTRQKDDEE